MNSDISIKELRELASMKKDAPDLYKETMEGIESVLKDFTSISMNIIEEMKKELE